MSIESMTNTFLYFAVLLRGKVQSDVIKTVQRGSLIVLSGIELGWCMMSRHLPVL